MQVSRFLFFAIILAAIWLAACAPAPTPTSVPTSVPPTATRVPPTNTAVPATATATATPTAIPPTSVPPTATPTATPTPKPVAIKSVQHATLGRILVDGDGRTLYLLTADNKSTSVCNDDCIKTWPLFLTLTKANAQEGVNAGFIGTLQRKDGSTQATYNGWPLYYRSTDTKPGDTTGQGLDGVWFVLTPNGDPVKPAADPPKEPGGYGGYGG